MAIMYECGAICWGHFTAYAAAAVWWWVMTIPLILASKSKPRRDILFHAGICPTIRVSHVDEDAVLAKAADEDMIVLTTPLTAYEVCGRLAGQGMPGTGRACC